MKNNALSRLNENITMDADVLKSYVTRVEDDVAQGIESYKKKIKTIYEEEAEIEGQSYYRNIEECEGLDSMQYSFETVFEVYFPRLQRASALITLWSFFEFSLNRLCNDLQREKSIKLKVKYINGKGVERALTYLLKVVELEFDKGSSVYNEIQNIQKVRNSYAHQDGEVTEKVKKYIEDNSLLSGEWKIIISAGYLMSVLETQVSFLRSIYESLEKTYH